VTSVSVLIRLSVGEFVRLALVIAGSIALANPKSSTLTFSSGVIFTFAGLRSRWTTAFSCAASSASVIWRAMARAASTGSPEP